MIVADYDTLEMRLLAAASLEPSMINLIKEGQDIHMGNATMVFGPMDGFDYNEISLAKKTDKKVKNGELPESAVTERMHHLLQRRLQAKTIGFGLVYGMKEYTLAARLGIAVPEAKKLMGAFMDTYPGVQSYLEEVVEETSEYGYSFTVVGRPRFFPGIISSKSSERSQAERQALNHSIQGAAADIVKLAMNRCFYEGDLERRFGCKMLLQVHDELMFECPPDSVEEVKPLIREYMEHSLPEDLAVPLTVSMGVGKSWAETH
jgi:DNA polymerase-1